MKISDATAKSTVRGNCRRVKELGAYSCLFRAFAAQVPGECTLAAEPFWQAWPQLSERVRVVALVGCRSDERENSVTRAQDGKYWRCSNIAACGMDCPCAGEPVGSLEASRHSSDRLVP